MKASRSYIFFTPRVISLRNPTPQGNGGTLVSFLAQGGPGTMTPKSRAESQGFFFSPKVSLRGLTTGSSLFSSRGYLQRLQLPKTMHNISTKMRGGPTSLPLPPPENGATLVVRGMQGLSLRLIGTDSKPFSSLVYWNFDGGGTACSVGPVCGERVSIYTVLRVFAQFSLVAFLSHLTDAQWSSLADLFTST